MSGTPGAGEARRTDLDELAEYFDKTDAGWSVKSIHLDVSAKVPSADPAKFRAAAEGAKKNCPISRLLNTQITMSAKLA